MRQAVLVLVHHPRSATLLPQADVDALAAIEEPGAEILRSLVADLREHPCASTGQLLERWRERPESERFARLATAESLIPDEAAALSELRTAIARMLEEGRMRRIDALLEKDGNLGLDREEKAELQRLMSARTQQWTKDTKR
jgi:DNA primase